MYILPADKEAAVQTGYTTVVEMHNELRDTPKTGDDSKLGLWLDVYKRQDGRTNLAKSTVEALRENFGNHIRIYRSCLLYTSRCV